MRQIILPQLRLQKPFALLFVLLLIVISCTKIDSSYDVKPEESIESFLTLPKNSSPELKHIISDLRKQLNRKNFANQFA